LCQGAAGREPEHEAGEQRGDFMIHKILQVSGDPPIDRVPEVPERTTGKTDRYRPDLWAGFHKFSVRASKLLARIF
jgi:hypothetical protein